MGGYITWVLNGKEADDLLKYRRKYPPLKVLKLLRWQDICLKALKKHYRGEDVNISQKQEDSAWKTLIDLGVVVELEDGWQLSNDAWDEDPIVEYGYPSLRERFFEQVARKVH